MDHLCRQKINARDNDDLSRSLQMTINRVQAFPASALKTNSQLSSNLSKTVAEPKVIGTDKSQEFEIESEGKTLRPTPRDSRMDQDNEIERQSFTDYLKLQQRSSSNYSSP